MWLPAHSQCLNSAGITGVKVRARRSQCRNWGTRACPGWPAPRPAHRPVHGHGHRHAVQRDAIEQQLQGGQGRHSEQHLSNSSCGQAGAAGGAERKVGTRGHAGQSCVATRGRAARCHPPVAAGARQTAGHKGTCHAWPPGLCPPPPPPPPHRVADEGRYVPARLPARLPANSPAPCRSARLAARPHAEPAQPPTPPTPPTFTTPPTHPPSCPPQSPPPRQPCPRPRTLVGGPSRSCEGMVCVWVGGCGGGAGQPSGHGPSVRPCCGRATPSRAHTLPAAQVKAGLERACGSHPRHSPSVCGEVKGHAHALLPSSQAFLHRAYQPAGGA